MKLSPNGSKSTCIPLRSFDIPPCRFHGAPIVCHNQRGLPLWPTNDHISSISASSPACSMATAISSGSRVRRNAVFTDSSAPSFLLSSRNTVSVLGSVLDVEMTILDKQSKGIPLDEQANDN